MAEKEAPVTLAEAYEQDLTGSIQLNPFPWNGQVFEIQDIKRLPVKRVRDRDGVVKTEHPKKNVYTVKLRDMKDEVELSGTHVLVAVARNKVTVNTSESGQQKTAAQIAKERQAAKKS